MPVVAGGSNGIEVEILSLDWVKGMGIFVPKPPIWIVVENKNAFGKMCCDFKVYMCFGGKPGVHAMVCANSQTSR